MQLHRAVCLLSVALSLSVAGQNAAPTPRTITLEECVALALEHNLDIRIQRYNPDIALYSLRSLYGAYDPQLSLGFSEGSSQQLPTYDPAYGGLLPAATGEGQNFSADISGVLPWGTSYQLGANLSNNEYESTRVFSVNYTTNPVTGIVTAEVTLTNEFTRVVRGQMGALQLRQPLLRDFWIDGSRYQIILGKQNLKSSELGLRYQIMNTVTSVESAYDTLIYTSDLVKVQEMAVELAEKLLAENKKRVEVGAMAPLDEKQAEAQLASSKADLLTAQRDLAVAQNVLKGLLTDDYSRWYGTDLRPATKLVAVPVSLDIHESWQRALAQRPDILQARLNVDRLGTALTYQKNQVYPRFDVVGSIGYSAAGASYGGALSQWGQGDAPFSSIGVQFSMPLGNQAARNNYKTAKAQREQADLQVRQLEQSVMVSIDNAITLVRSSLERVNATREARVYSQAALDAEVKKLENGKSTSFEVLRLQRDLTSSRSAEIQALAAYNISVAQLAFAEGTTLERHKLDVAAR